MTVELDQKAITRLREYFVSRQTDVLALARQLVECESPSGDEAGSRAIVDVVARMVETIDGVTSVERIVSQDYGEHLRARFFPQSNKGNDTAARSTLLIGHTDTVHPRGSLEQRPWRAEQDRIYAPGIFDMKANCALLLEVLGALSVLDLVPQREVVLLLTCDEETGSMHGGRRLVEAEAQGSQNVLVLEPPASGGRVKTERKGTGVFTIEAYGQAAHAGLEPEKGASAILELARQIARLDAMNDSASGTSVNVGTFTGGTKSNVVAAEARAEVDVRFTTSAEANRIKAALHELQPFDTRVRLHVSGGINRLPLERTPAVLSLYAQARRIAAQLDFELGEASVGGASDGNFAAALGVPVLDGLGISGDGAHASHEHINSSDIPFRGALLTALIASL